jgi:phosphate-selective porin OprO/OprP
VRVFLLFPALIWIFVPCLMIGSISVSSDAHAEDGAAAASPAPETPKAATGSRVNVTLDQKGFRAQTEDGQFKFKMGGRVHVDGTYHVGDTPDDIPVTPPTTPPTSINLEPTDGAEIRRARLIAKATVYEDWDWVGEVDFADNDTVVKDFFLSYSGFENTKITVGNQKQPYSLSLEMSSNDIPFVERSSDNEQNILLDRAIGVRVDTNGEHWFFAAGIYGDGVKPQKVGGDEGWGLAARGVVAPIKTDNRVLHLGFRSAFRRADRADSTGRFRDETTHMSNYRVVDTGSISDLDSVVLYGPEAAVAIGPVWVFGEYSRMLLRRNGVRNSKFESGHIGVAWTLTGESRAANYAIKSGEFKSITPKENFSLSNGGGGAWEVAMRYAYIDASDGSATNAGSIYGGEEHVLSTALNWYVNPNVRFMLNWNHILETNVGSGASASLAATNHEAKGLDVFTLRTQLNF